MKKQKDNKNQPLRAFSIAMACGVGMLITGCVAAVPVAVTPVAPVHTTYGVHRPVAVAPVVVRPVAPVVRAASPVGVGGTARRTSRRVTRRR